MNDTIQLVVGFAGGVMGGFLLSALLRWIYNRSKWTHIPIGLLLIITAFGVALEDPFSTLDPLFWLNACMKGAILGTAMDSVYDSSIREKKWQEFLWLSGWWKVFKIIFRISLLWIILQNVLNFLSHTARQDLDPLLQILIILCIIANTFENMDRRKKIMDQLKNQKWACIPFRCTERDALARLHSSIQGVPPENRHDYHVMLFSVLSDHMGIVKLRSFPDHHVYSDKDGDFVITVLSKETLEAIRSGEDLFYAVYTESPIFCLGDSFDIDNWRDALKKEHPNATVHRNIAEIHTVSMGKDTYFRMTITYKNGVKCMDTAKDNQNFVGADTAKNLIALSANKQSMRSVEEKEISPTVIPSNTQENNMDLFIQDKAKSEK